MFEAASLCCQVTATAVSALRSIIHWKHLLILYLCPIPWRWATSTTMAKQISRSRLRVILTITLCRSSPSLVCLYCWVTATAHSKKLLIIRRELVQLLRREIIHLIWRLATSTATVYPIWPLTTRAAAPTLVCPCC